MEREMIIKALECCHSHSHKHCPECPYNKDIDGKPCFMRLMEHSLTLINELTEQVEKDNKTIIDLYHEGETYLAQRDCLRNLVKNLTEENERLRAEEKQSQIMINTLHDKLDEGYAKFVDEERADTVRKMHTEIKERCIKGGIYPAFVARTIDQIAKEMLEGTNEEG